jgi:hypothetical protein
MQNSEAPSRFERRGSGLLLYPARTLPKMESVRNWSGPEPGECGNRESLGIDRNQSDGIASRPGGWSASTSEGYACAS